MCLGYRIDRTRPFCDTCWSEIPERLRNSIQSLASGCHTPSPAVHNPHVFLQAKSAQINLALKRRHINGEEAAARMALASHAAQRLAESYLETPLDPPDLIQAMEEQIPLPPSTGDSPATDDG